MRRSASEPSLSNPDDLAANRSGRLTDGQRRQAMQVNWVAGCFVIAMAVFMGSVFGLPFVLAFFQEELEWALVVPGLICLAMGAPIALLVAIQGVRLALTRRDLEAGEVQQADGLVVWRGHRYAAEFPGRAFWSSNTVAGLPPGPYRFYYLPRSGRVLSAQAMPGLMVAETMPGGALATLDGVLGQVIGFSAGDIELNRQGQLAPGQRARLLAAMFGFSLLGLGLLAFCGFVAWAMWTDLDGEGWAAALPLGILALIGLLGPVAIGWQIVKMGRDLLGGQVVFVDGPVTRSAVRGGKSTSYYYGIGGQKFTVSLQAYEAMVSGQSFRAYYTPHTKRLVGLEPWAGGGGRREQ